MDGEAFDALVKRLTRTRLSRLEALRGVSAGALAGLVGIGLLEGGEAKHPANRVIRGKEQRRRKARKERRKRRRQQRRDKRQDQQDRADDLSFVGNCVPLGQLCNSQVGDPCCNPRKDALGLGATCAHPLTSANPLTFCLDGSKFGQACNTTADCTAYYANPKQDVACEDEDFFSLVAKCPADVRRCCVQKPCASNNDCPTSHLCCKSLVGDRCCARGQSCNFYTGCGSG